MSSLSASSGSSAANQVKRPDLVLPLLRGAVLPALVAGALVTLGAGVLAGTRGVAGALIGLAVVVLFSGTGLLIMRAVRNTDAMITMMVGLFSYTVRIILFGAAIMVLGALDTDSWLHRGSFVISVLLCVAAWIGGEIRAYNRLRIPVYDIEDPARDEGEGGV
jgi:ATP synthase protein I